MKIYVGHSSNFEYGEHLYKPLKQSEIVQEHEFVFPHEDSEEPFDSKSFLQEECDLFLAEVSEPSTGLGIELGWADMFDVPILCVNNLDSDPSSSISAVSNDKRSYEDSERLIAIIGERIEELEEG